MEVIKDQNHVSNVLISREQLFMTGDFSDVTLVSDDLTQFKCHKMILASTSDVFRQLLQLNTELHPIVFLKGVAQKEMKALLDYIYLGTITIEPDSAILFREAAAQLHIKIEENEEPCVKEDIKRIQKLEFLSSTTKTENKQNQPFSTNVGLNFLNFTEEEDCDELGVEEDEYVQEENTGQNDNEKTIDFEDASKSCDYGLNATLDENKCINSEEEIEGDKPKKKKGKQNRKTEEEPSECEICATKFTTKRSLQRHSKIIHELQTIDCHLCGKTFKGRDNLRPHIQNFHEKRRYPCTKCEKTFHSTKSLKSHFLNEHTAKCVYCNLNFAELEEFNKHIQVEHVNKFCK